MKQLHAAAAAAVFLATTVFGQVLYPRSSIVFTTDGTCGNDWAGAGRGMHCPLSGSNLCCSYKGYCGDTSAHCSNGCQAEFGRCAEDATRYPRPTECGPAHNGTSCQGGECCSTSGYCGTGEKYCRSPDCLRDFGACDATLLTPAGENTTGVDRGDLGSSVDYGTGVYHCTKPGTVALTFDDGPYNFTTEILDLLAKYDMKATFFVTGVNLGKGEIDDPQYGWDVVIQRMVDEGHQVASHTWSHADLSKLDQAQRRDEVVKLEMALRNILGEGWIPTYIRPPYSSCDADCLADLKDLGYHVTYFDLDTDDYNRATPDLIGGSKDLFSDAVANGNPSTDKFLAIAHDIQKLTADVLTEFMLQTVKDAGFEGVTVGECLGDPEDNWYRGGNRTTKEAATASSTAAGATAGSAGAAHTTAAKKSAGSLAFNAGGCSAVGFALVIGLLVAVLQQ